MKMRKHFGVMHRCLFFIIPQHQTLKEGRKSKYIKKDQEVKVLVILLWHGYYERMTL